MLENPSINSVTILSFDLSKAFDRVDHKILLIKLQKFFPSFLINWITDYLSERKQKIIFNNSSSDFANVTSGVPQGSILSPLLLHIYIDDLQINE